MTPSFRVRQSAPIHSIHIGDRLRIDENIIHCVQTCAHVCHLQHNPPSRGGQNEESAAAVAAGIVPVTVLAETSIPSGGPTLTLPPENGALHYPEVSSSTSRGIVFVPPAQYLLRISIPQWNRAPPCSRVMPSSSRTKSNSLSSHSHSLVVLGCLARG